MTEYELGEMLYNTYDGLWQGSQMYFTLFSAYLVIAYLVGTKLNRAHKRKRVFTVSGRTVVGPLRFALLHVERSSPKARMAG